MVVAGALTLALAACGDDDGGTVREIGGSGSASGSGSGSGSASGSAPGSASGIATPLGGYTPASDVSEHAKVSLDVCAINEELDAETIDFDAVEEIYRDGGSSMGGDGPRTLAGFAIDDERDSETWVEYSEFFDRETWLDDDVAAARNGTGAFAGEPDGVRRQGVQKGVQNQIMIAWVLHELDEALAKADAGELDPAEGAPHNWDEAFAFYWGEQMECGSPAATADKRGENFATGTAVNDAIVAEMQAGVDALVAGNVARARAANAEVRRQITITYLQAVKRYGHVIDQMLADGDPGEARIAQAEGGAFLRVVEPLLAGADAAATEQLVGVYDLGSSPTEGSGAAVDAAVAALATALGITDAEIGTLQED
jgi:hypothetical protein